MVYNRLLGRIYPRQSVGRQVASIRLRVQALIPAGCVVDVADVQLQPGVLVTGWTFNSQDVGVVDASGWAWRNGILPSGTTAAVVVADEQSASPCRWDMIGPTGISQAGSFRFGAVADCASVDGYLHTATQGAGIPPHVTARSDIDVPVTLAARGHATCWLRGIATSDLAVKPPAPTPDAGSVTGAHTTWGQVLATHPGWASVVSTHQDWS